MTLKVNSILCRQCLHIVTNWLRLESHGFRHKVTLYLSYLRIKFDDKIRRESLHISNNHRTKLSCRLAWAASAARCCGY